MKIYIKKGLDIPMSGKPEGGIQALPQSRQIALNLDPFDDIRFKVLIKAGDSVKIGQPLVESKTAAGLFFASPASGVVSEVRRGLKRRLLDIVIDVPSHEEEKYEEWGSLAPSKASQDEIIAHLMRGGLFPHIRMRPFNLIANPKFPPRDIFVKAVETLPFVPSAELQVEGHADLFQIGLETLTRLTSGNVHLVYKEGSSFSSFSNIRGVIHHTVTGPHPAGTSSVHIHFIAPVQKADDYVWTLSALDVLAVGKMMAQGRYFTERIISIAGNGIIEGKRGFFKGRAGYPVTLLMAGRIHDQAPRLISGDPLTGVQVEESDFLGFYHTAFSVIPERAGREPFHFLRLGLDKFTATGAYLSGHVKPPEGGYPFTTNQHGEERAFIDGAVYERVMPMRIPTMHLVKAIISEDFELAEKLGILEVASEDFALPTFICPSKIEMMDIVKQGLHQLSKEMGF